MSFFTVRIPVRNRNGLTKRSVGSGNMLRGDGCSWGFCVFGSAGCAGVSPHVHRIWATQVCLSLDTPSGRRSVGALSSWFSGSSLVSPSTRLENQGWQFILRWCNAAYASLSEITQSPWLLCMYGIFGLMGHSGETAGKIYVRLFCPQFVFFVLSELFRKILGGGALAFVDR